MEPKAILSAKMVKADDLSDAEDAEEEQPDESKFKKKSDAWIR
jgi:hypothetical protein